MAGLGRKVFTAGDVLTASQVQDYLQDQAVMVFAGTAARSSAIATPSEGMISYQKDTDAIEAYDGANWVTRVSTSVPYATNAGTATITGSGTITFAASRFTQTPLVSVNVQTTSNAATSVTYAGASTAGITVYVWSGSTASTIARTVNFLAVQMTSAAAAG
jgi:hypothetical protein